ncbi:MAG: S24 family peptidase [Bacteroidia bacterium]|nr:S24 family peptidase [Bacteroidia bacterium]
MDKEEKDGRGGARPEVKKDGRGGARPGAGRPPGDGRLYTFRASGEMAEVIGRQKSKTDFIRNCISREIRRAAGEAVCPEETAAGGVRAAANVGESTRAVPEASAGTVPATYAGESTRAVPEASAGAIPAARPEYNSRAVPATSVRGLRLPFFDLGIRAGFPIPLDNDEKAQDIELLRLLCPHPEASYLIRVAGDSMIDAGIDDGDIIIVDKSRRNPSPSEVAVCELNGEYTLKRFEKDGDGSGWLVPANPAYPRIRISEGDSFSVWGTVSYIIHKPRP